MCEICGQNPCLSLCPNYVGQPAHCHCSICGYGILPGEQYVENDFRECAHIDCIDTAKDMANFLKYEIKTMGGTKYE